MQIPATASANTMSALSVFGPKVNDEDSSRSPSARTLSARFCFLAL
tara:strand:+ start:308 stop:445 length:138 start_codon:yes stop_codon:yes gene_type:complete